MASPDVALVKLASLRTFLLVIGAIAVAFYAAAAVLVASSDRTVPEFSGEPVFPASIAIFGASGTAGDGILKAALAEPAIERILVVTRRTTPRIEEGVASGRIEIIKHLDYMDYAPLIDRFSDVDTVYWAIGISALGADRKTYGRIHVDFPMAFIRAWESVAEPDYLVFQFISSSDISEDSTTMWVQEKIRAEQSLFAFAQGRRLRVIAHRPDYIGPTTEEAHLGQHILYGFFRPVGAAVKATEIGKAMLELSARGAAIASGYKVSTPDIILYGRAYDQRQPGGD